MGVFDFVDTNVKNKLTTDGFVVEDNIETVGDYRSGNHILHISSPDVPSVSETQTHQCVLHNVQFVVNIFCYDYDGTKNTQHMSTIYEGVVDSLFHLRDKSNGVQDLTLISAGTNLNFNDNGRYMSAASLVYQYQFQQKISAS